MMEPVDFRELVRRDSHETLAADLGIDPAKMEQPMDDEPTITAYRTDKKGYRHWEIRRITYLGGSPDYYQHRDRQTQGEWRHGLPEEVKGKDLISVEGVSPPPPADESASKRRQAAQEQESAAASPEETIEPASTLTLEAATTTAEILEAVARFIRRSCRPP